MDNVITLPARPSAKVINFKAAAAKHAFDVALAEVRLKEARRSTKKSRAAKAAYSVSVHAKETL